jgi:hypothetical protein
MVIEILILPMQGANLICLRDRKVRIISNKARHWLSDQKLGLFSKGWEFKPS